MNRDCKDGLRLRLLYEHTLKEWGWFDAYERALERIPVDPARVHEFHEEARTALSEMHKARLAYVDHMSRCLHCSRRIVAPDAVDYIRERLESSGLQ